LNNCYIVILNNSKLAYRIYVILIANKELIKKNVGSGFAVCSSPSKESYRLCVRIKKLKSNRGPTTAVEQ
jgi:hypothetical protein